MKKEEQKREYILEYDLVFVNILSAILLVGMIILTILLLNILPSSMPDTLIPKLSQGEFENNFLALYAIFFIVMILWMVLHEIIHSIAYQVVGAKNKNIVFGAALDKGVFYCKCKEYVDKKCIMTSLLSPFIFIGIITYILGFIFSSSWLIILSIVNISGAAGDLMMFNFFLKQKNDIEFKELGYSSPFCLRTTDDLTDKKFIGIKSIKKVTDSKETEEGPEKKVTISKASWVVIIFLIVLVTLMFLLQIFINKIDKEENNLNQEKNREVLKLFEDYSEKNVTWDMSEDNTIAEFPGVTFKINRDAHTDDNLYAIQGEEEKHLIYGVPILYTYKVDLTGDDKPEIITNVMFGYGMCDTHIEVYDYANEKKYVLWDRGEFDYFLYHIDNELVVIKINYGSELFYISKGNLKLVLDESHPDGGYLTIENEEEI